MSKQIFFKPNDDLPNEYVKYVALQFASQIGTANFSTLGITSIDLMPPNSRECKARGASFTSLNQSPVAMP